MPIMTGPPCTLLWIADQVRNDVGVATFHHCVAGSYLVVKLLGVAWPRPVDTGSSPV